jgi:hypothetical protein
MKLEKNVKKSTNKKIGRITSNEITKLQSEMKKDAKRFRTFNLMSDKKEKQPIYAMQNGKSVELKDILKNIANKNNGLEIEDSDYDWNVPDSIQYDNTNDFSWVMSLMPPFLPVPICEQLMQQNMIGLLNSLIPESIYGLAGVTYYCTDPQKENSPEIIKELKTLNDYRKKRDKLKNNMSLNDLMLQSAIYMQSVGGAMVYCKTKTANDYLENGDQESILPLFNDKYSIPKNSLDGFIFVDPLYYQTMIAEQYINPLDWGFYESKYVWCNVQNAHESRFLRFRNNLRPLSTQYLSQRNWNYQSQTELIISALLAYYDRNTTTTALMNRKNLMVYKLPSMNSTEELQDQLYNFNATRDNFQTIIIDDEKGELILLDYNMTDFPELGQQQLEYIPVALGYPQTVVLGTSPGGMGSKGNFEENMWARKVIPFWNINLYPLEHDAKQKLCFNFFGEDKDYIDVKMGDINIMSAEDKLKYAQAFKNMAESGEKIGAYNAQDIRTMSKDSFPEFTNSIGYNVPSDAVQVDAKSDNDNFDNKEKNVFNNKKDKK